MYIDHKHLLHLHINNSGTHSPIIRSARYSESQWTIETIQFLCHSCFSFESFESFEWFRFQGYLIYWKCLELWLCSEFSVKWQKTFLWSFIVPKVFRLFVASAHPTALPKNFALFDLHILQFNLHSAFKQNVSFSLRFHENFCFICNESLWVTYLSNIGNQSMS